MVKYHQGREERAAKLIPMSFLFRLCQLEWIGDCSTHLPNASQQYFKFKNQIWYARARICKNQDGIPPKLYCKIHPTLSVGDGGLLQDKTYSVYAKYYTVSSHML